MVTVAATRGSAPRAAGTHMFVTQDQVIATIGGGNLEYQAIARAREILQQSEESKFELKRYVLGKDMGQCCGGMVYLHYAFVDVAFRQAFDELYRQYQSHQYAALLAHCAGNKVKYQVFSQSAHSGESKAIEGRFNQLDFICSLLESGQLPKQDAWPEYRLWFQYEQKWIAHETKEESEAYCVLHVLKPPQFRVVIFGAGHVGKALVHVLNPLADEIVWCDEREQEFPNDVPNNVRIYTDDPFSLIQQQGSKTYYLIMTHNHSLDMLLVESILKRKDAAYCGLIGSASKRQRFENVLVKEGMSQHELGQLICPIGVAGIKDKQPAAIAVAVAAELLQVKESLQSD